MWVFSNHLDHEYFLQPFMVICFQVLELSFPPSLFLSPMPLNCVIPTISYPSQYATQAECGATELKAVSATIAF